MYTIVLVYIVQLTKATALENMHNATQMTMTALAMLAAGVPLQPTNAKAASPRQSRIELASYTQLDLTEHLVTASQRRVA